MKIPKGIRAKTEWFTEADSMKVLAWDGKRITNVDELKGTKSGVTMLLNTWCMNEGFFKKEQILGILEKALEKKIICPEDIRMLVFKNA